MHANTPSTFIKRTKITFTCLSTLLVVLSVSLLSSMANAQSLDDLIAQSAANSAGLDANLPSDSNNTSAQASATATTNAVGSGLDDTQNLSAQIETLKQAMVNLNRDLFILEEDLLFPSSTQVAVYLAMNVGEYFALDAVEIRVDGEVKTYYLYTDRQVNALYRGGVQRLYVGNVSQGKHTLSAYFVGIGPQNREYKRAVSIEFEKDEKFIEE